MQHGLHHTKQKHYISLLASSIDIFVLLTLANVTYNIPIQL